MENLPLVSIICTAFNHDKYIQDALEGFLMQKTRFPFEIIVHDDASKDNTAAIIKAYEEKHPNLFCAIYQKENQYSKRNVNIWIDITFPLAKGKYIAICEGDDYWIDPLKLQKQIDTLEADPTLAACCHNALILNENIQIKPYYFNTIEFEKKLTIEDVIDNWNIPTASLVFRRELVDNLPNWMKNVHNCDYALEMILASRGNISFINKAMSIYRVGCPSSLTIVVSKNNVKYLKKRIELFCYFDEYMQFQYHAFIEKSIQRLNFEIFKYKIKKILTIVGLLKFVKKVGLIK